MPSNKRWKQKGRRDSGSFVMLPHAVLRNPNYARLSYSARSLLFDLLSQYNGKNNGDFSLAPKIMQAKGWRSQGTVHQAKKELLKTGWIICTRQGGRNMPSLFAVTFQSIDECKGKLDVKETATALGYWKLGHNPNDKMPSP